MGIGVILSRVPWGKVVTLLPPIIKTARELLAKSKQEEIQYPVVYESNADLEERIHQLEENERQQAALIEKIAVQLQNFADTIQIIDTRMRTILWLALLALLFSLSTLIYVLFK